MRIEEIGTGYIVDRVRHGQFDLTGWYNINGLLVEVKGDGPGGKTVRYTSGPAWDKMADIDPIRRTRDNGRTAI
jgi:hypothetical protein